MNQIEASSTVLFFLIRIVELAAFCCCIPPLRRDLRTLAYRKFGRPLFWVLIAIFAIASFSLIMVSGSKGYWIPTETFEGSGGIPVPGSHPASFTPVLFSLVAVSLFLTKGPATIFQRLMERKAIKIMTWIVTLFLALAILAGSGLEIVFAVGMSGFGSPNSQLSISRFLPRFALLAAEVLIPVIVWNIFALKPVRSTLAKIALSALPLLLLSGYAMPVFDSLFFALRAFNIPFPAFFFRLLIGAVALVYLHFIWKQGADGDRDPVVRAFTVVVVLGAVALMLRHMPTSQPSFDPEKRVAAMTPRPGTGGLLTQNQAKLEEQAATLLASIVGYLHSKGSLGINEVTFPTLVPPYTSLPPTPGYFQLKPDEGFWGYCVQQADCEALGYRPVAQHTWFKFADSGGSWLEIKIVPVDGKAELADDRVTFRGKKLITKRCSHNPWGNGSGVTCGIVTLPFPGIAGERISGPALAHWDY